MPSDTIGADSHLNQLAAITRFQREVTVETDDTATRRQRVAELALAITGADGAAVEEVDGDDMVYRACAGTMAEHLGLRVPVAGSVSGAVFHDRRARVVDNVDTDDAVQLKQKAREAGFVSGVLVPIVHGGRVYGVVKATAAQPNRFGAEARHLLELASAIAATSLYHADAQAEERHRRTLLVDALPALIAYLDTGLRYREVNAAYENLFGMSADAIRGLHVSELLGESAYNETRADMEAALQGTRVWYEHDVTGGDGVTRAYRVNLVPHHDTGGAVQGLYLMVSDITEERSAAADFLTGLANRRALERRGTQAVAAAQRYGHALSLMILDVDHFKHINDTHGHLGGDEVLKALTALLAQLTRRADILGRWGGEEFALILPHTEAANAEHLAERVRRAVTAHTFPREVPVTVSVGVATLRDGDDLHTLTDRADAALYGAKQAGRDRVMVAAEDGVTPPR